MSSVSAVGTGHRRLAAPRCARAQGRRDISPGTQIPRGGSSSRHQSWELLPLQLSAKPVLFQRARSGRYSLQRYITSSQGALVCSSKAVEWGNGFLGTSRRICVLHFQTHLQGKCRKNFLLDAVEFGGLRRTQSFVSTMRVDVHLSHLLVLLCFVLAEVEESFQQVQVEVVQCDNSDPGHKTEQAWKTTCSL